MNEARESLEQFIKGLTPEQQSTLRSFEKLDENGRASVLIQVSMRRLLDAKCKLDESTKHDMAQQFLAFYRASCFLQSLRFWVSSFRELRMVEAAKIVASVEDTAISITTKEAGRCKLFSEAIEAASK